MLRRAPAQFGEPQTRWTLPRLAAHCPWLTLTTSGGLSQLLKRLRISYKRGREYVHSPDPDYVAKVGLIELRRLAAQYAPEQVTFLYLDELTYYRQPTLAHAYEAMGAVQPFAVRSHRSNTSFRVLAALNAWTGQVHYLQRSHTDIPCFTTFWTQLRAAYPTATQLYVTVDNWPVHFHPDVLAPLQPQAFPFPLRTPPNWPTTPSPKAVPGTLPIQLLCLPTYASWLNPIEKLWRWLKQDILHLHRQSDEWLTLKGRVDRFLAGFSEGSEALLRYTGLLPN